MTFNIATADTFINRWLTEQNMPRPMYRSRTFRRVKVKTPGGTVKIHYKKPKNKQAHCAECKRVLPGVARGTKTTVRKAAKSSRRPERPFGGNLCSACMRQELKNRARS